MPQKIIFATSNKDKIREVREIMSDPGVEILSIPEAGVNVNIEENGETFEENARIKAKAVWDVTGGIVLADDSGLVVDALGGEPGVYSARYLGYDTPYEIKNRDIIARLSDVSGADRSARFECVIAAVLEDGRIITTRGAMEGIIAYEPAGEGGFGYDPILYLPEYGMTSAEIDAEEKNRISHRGKALRAMRDLLGEEKVLI